MRSEPDSRSRVVVVVVVVVHYFAPQFVQLSPVCFALVLSLASPVMGTLTMKIAALAACLSVAAADSKTCSAGCSGGRGGVECTGDDGDKGSCFFSSCTCEYRGTVSGCSTSDACVGWKQTGDGCDSKGRKVGSSELAATLAAGKNLACCEYVPTGAVGYCECRNGAKVREVGCGGRTDNFNCQAECEKAGYQPTPNAPPPPPDHPPPPPPLSPAGEMSAGTMIGLGVGGAVFFCCCCCCLLSRKGQRDWKAKLGLPKTATLAECKEAQKRVDLGLPITATDEECREEVQRRAEALEQQRIAAALEKQRIHDAHTLEMAMIVARQPKLIWEDVELSTLSGTGSHKKIW